jgi:hypothetical protein
VKQLLRKNKLTIRYDKKGMELKVLQKPEGYEYELKDWGEE